MSVVQYDSREQETNTRVDIFRYYGSTVLPGRNRRKLPTTPEIQIEMTNKQIWWERLKRFLKFALHFITVNVLLFSAAVVFAYIEDPEHQDFTPPFVNQTVCSNGTYISDKAFNDGNATIFFMYMEQHYNIEIGENSRDEFLKHVNSFQTAVNARLEQELYEKHIHDREYIFSKWFYFVTVATTTIGYGDVAPKTSNGRLFYIVFSVIGIPLMMSLLASCGEVMTSANKVVFGLINKYLCKQRKLVSEELLSAISIFMLLAGYIAVGCIFVASVEEWSFIESTYYWVVTFTTVGFGDVNQSVETQVKYIVPLVVYRSFGLALLAGFIDSILAWITVRREYFEAEAKRLKEANRSTFGATKKLLTPKIFKKKYEVKRAMANGCDREQRYVEDHRYDGDEKDIEESSNLRTSNNL